MDAQTRLLQGLSTTEWRSASKIAALAGCDDKTAYWQLPRMVANGRVEARSYQAPRKRPQGRPRRTEYRLLEGRP